MDDPPGSRLFVVCGKSAKAEVLQSAFEPFGTIQNVKVIRDKGVAYVKFDTASAAACAMENLNGAVLNNGRGPKLKVLLAESPNARNNPQTRQQLDLELACDPDNIPPRSRLFLVVPKTADAMTIKAELSKYPDLDYCKTDLIQSKGVVFAKYAKASSALKGMEEICDSGMLAGYKVKCMLAEPKSKRARLDSIMANSGYGHSLQTQLDFNMGGLHLSNPHPARPVPGLALGGVGTLASMASMSMGPLSSMPGLGKMDSPISPQGSLSGLGSLGGMRIGAPGTGLSRMALNTPGVGQMMDNQPALSGGDMNSYSAVDSTLSPTGSSPSLSKQRLFVVVYKGVTEEMLARLFRRFPGMEYCDLKKDKRTGKSKGYCYVNYSTHEAAGAAVQHLNGIEFPPHSGHRLKVMFAEPLGVKSSPLSTISYSSQTCESGRRFKNSSQEGCDAGVFEECDSGNGSVLVDDNVDDTKVYTALTRPMPEYTLHHLFSKFGKVEYVRLQQDRRLGIVKFSGMDSARDALQMLNGADVLGETLTVSSGMHVGSPGELTSQMA
ncbi:hypothetical protein BSKO_04966 [Bryopsis sp. KO-2023]|nr:hypothetical protein BSKO_04966 [Bryopsis sp. KO-2023]